MGVRRGDAVLTVITVSMIICSEFDGSSCVVVVDVFCFFLSFRVVFVCLLSFSLSRCLMIPATESVYCLFMSSGGARVCLNRLGVSL